MTIHTTGRPSWAPGRSQSAAAGGDGGGSRAAGSSAAGAGASGPKPSWAVIAIAAHATRPRAAMASATSSGVTDTDAIRSGENALPVAMPARATTTPIATGAPIANRISSRDQRIGWATFATTATIVRATIIATNGRLPKPVPDGTLIAR